MGGGGSENNPCSEMGPNTNQQSFNEKIAVTLVSHWTWNNKLINLFSKKECDRKPCNLVAEEGFEPLTQGLWFLCVPYSAT